MCVKKETLMIYFCRLCRSRRRGGQGGGRMPVELLKKKVIFLLVVVLVFIDSENIMHKNRTCHTSSSPSHTGGAKGSYNLRLFNILLSWLLRTLQRCPTRVLGGAKGGRKKVGWTRSRGCDLVVWTALRCRTADHRMTAAVAAWDWRWWRWGQC